MVYKNVLLRANIAAQAPFIIHLLFLQMAVYCLAPLIEMSVNYQLSLSDGQVSGQCVNFDKSNALCCTNTPLNYRELLCYYLRVHEVNGLGTYLN